MLVLGRVDALVFAGFQILMQYFCLKLQIFPKLRSKWKTFKQHFPQLTFVILMTMLDGAISVKIMDVIKKLWSKKKVPFSERWNETQFQHFDSTLSGLTQ